MTEKNTIKELEAQANNTRLLVERLTKAHYGITVPEIIKSIGGENRGGAVQGNPGEEEHPERTIRRPDDPDSAE